MEKAVEYQKLIENAVSQIFVNGNKYATAFVIKDQYLLSAGHPFEKLERGQRMTAKFIDGKEAPIQLIRCVYDAEHLKDYAIFKAEKGSFGRKSLPLLFDENVEGDFISTGSGDIFPGFSNSKGECVGRYYHNDHEYFLKLTSGQSGQAGFSGAPIFSLLYGAVIGIQCEATINDIGAERDTVLAFPIIRLLEDEMVRDILKEESTVKISSFIERNLLPVFGKALLGLNHSDNMDAYMRCIVVKLVPEQNMRFTVLTAETSGDTLSAVIRKHHKTRKMKYGVIGGMLKANVPIMYDFKNSRCYQLDLGGTSRESTLLNDKNRGAREDRIALLVAPIRNERGEIIGVLSFDFFPVQNPEKDITELVKNNKGEAGRILYLSELYAQTISKLLLSNLEKDIDFMHILP